MSVTFGEDADAAYIYLVDDALTRSLSGTPTLRARSRALPGGSASAA